MTLKSTDIDIKGMADLFGEHEGAIIKAIDQNYWKGRIAATEYADEYYSILQEKDFPEESKDLVLNLWEATLETPKEWYQFLEVSPP